MNSDHELVLVAAYGNLESARRDFGDLERRLQHGLELRGAALVAKNADGHPEVVEAANRHGRTGAGMGAGVGLLFGLFAPPLGLAVLVGATVGGLVTSFAEHELRSGLRHEIGEALEAGTAVIVSVVYRNCRASVESALGRSDTITELRPDRATINSLDEAVAAAMISTGKPGTSS
ncbi:MAG: DUF1269 domain-containing protein [Mycobacterium sp.]